MKMLTVDTLEQVREKLWQAACELPQAEELCPLGAARGRVLRRPVAATAPVPAFPRSTVDGYAVVAADTQGAGESLPVFLTIVGEVAMGEAAALTISSGQCVYVPTGGMLPAGADAMVMVEYCERFDQQQLAVAQAVAPGASLVSCGEDVQAGQEVLPAGRVVRAQDLGAAAALGLTELPVWRPWRLTLISTGDELCQPGQPLKPGQVYDINGPAVSAAAEQLGLAVVRSLAVVDDPDVLAEAVRQALPDSELVLVSGGSSQGEKDATARIFSELADPGVFTHGIALKPGKPTIGAYDRSSRTLLIGLPGHPAAALLVFELLLGWLMRQLRGQVAAPSLPARLTANVAAAPGKTTCLPVRLTMDQAGYLAQPVWGKSGLITTLSGAGGYLLIDQNREGLTAGAAVQVHLL